MHISLFKVQCKAVLEFTFLSETNCNCLSPNPGAELFPCSSPSPAQEQVPTAWWLHPMENHELCPALVDAQ